MIKENRFKSNYLRLFIQDIILKDCILIRTSMSSSCHFVDTWKLAKLIIYRDTVYNSVRTKFR